MKVLVILLGLTVVACGGDDDDSTDVDAATSDVDADTTAVDADTSDVDAPPPAVNYCTPPPWKSGPFTGLVNTTLETLNNSTTFNDGGAEVYTYFTAATVPALSKNGSYTVTTLTGGTAAGDNNSRVWIDYNQDGDFTDAGEEVAAWNNHATTVQTANFTVPAGAATGTTRMRVFTDMSEAQGHISPLPCGYLDNLGHSIGQHGEVEDYDVSIAP